MTFFATPLQRPPKREGGLFVEIEDQEKFSLDACVKLVNHCLSPVVWNFLVVCSPNFKFCPLVHLKNAPRPVARPGRK